MQYRCFFGLCFCLLFLTPAFGQMAFHINVSSSIDGEEQFQSATEMVRNSVEFHLKNRLAQMNEVCELTPKQIAKLNVAKNLGISDFMDIFETKNRKHLKARQKSLGYDFDEEGTPIWNENAEPKGEGGRLLLSCADIERMELRWKWRETYQNVLTEEQLTVWKEWMAENNASKEESDPTGESNVTRSSAVNAFVDKTARSLFLTEEQKDDIGKLIDQHYGQQLFQKASKKRKRELVMLRVGLEEVWDRPYETELEEILSEEQLNYWNIFIEPVLDSLR